MYAGLKDLAGERRAKLDEALQLFMLNREVDDLEQWISEREIVASSQELGQDYDHVTLLWERFREFAKDTESIGSERVSVVNGIADSLIAAGHSDAATIAEWKDGLNEVFIFITLKIVAFFAKEYITVTKTSLTIFSFTISGLARSTRNDRNTHSDARCKPRIAQILPRLQRCSWTYSRKTEFHVR